MLALPGVRYIRAPAAPPRRSPASVRAASTISTPQASAQRARHPVQPRPVAAARREPLVRSPDAKPAPPQAQAHVAMSSAAAAAAFGAAVRADPNAVLAHLAYRNGGVVAASAQAPAGSHHGGPDGSVPHRDDHHSPVGGLLHSLAHEAVAVVEAPVDVAKVGLGELRAQADATMASVVSRAMGGSRPQPRGPVSTPVHSPVQTPGTRVTEILAGGALVLAGAGFGTALVVFGASETAEGGSVGGVAGAHEILIGISVGSGFIGLGGDLIYRGARG